jgi:hypothetical protein
MNFNCIWLRDAFLRSRRVKASLLFFTAKPGGSLGEEERFDTRTSIRTNLLMASVPAFSVLLVVIFINSPFAGPIAGFAYFLYTPIMFAHGIRAGKKRKELIGELGEKSE